MAILLRRMICSCGSGRQQGPLPAACCQWQAKSYLAALHYKRALLDVRGVRPWRALVRRAHQAWAAAISNYRRSLARPVLAALAALTRRRDAMRAAEQAVRCICVQARETERSKRSDTHVVRCYRGRCTMVERGRGWLSCTYSRCFHRTQALYPVPVQRLRRRSALRFALHALVANCARLRAVRAILSNGISIQLATGSTYVLRLTGERISRLQRWATAARPQQSRSCLRAGTSRCEGYTGKTCASKCVYRVGEGDERRSRDQGGEGARARTVGGEIPG